MTRAALVQPEAPAPLPDSAAASPPSSAGAQDTAASPRFDIVRVAPSGSAVIAGRASPDAEVALLDNGTEIGRAKADDSGQFVVIPDRKLPVGGQELALEEQRPDGAAVKGDTPALVVVPERAGEGREQAKKQDAAETAGKGAVAVLAPPDAAPRLLSVPSDEPAKKGQVALRVVDYDAKGAIRFAGTARPGSVVRLYVDNRPIGEARADAAGRWAMAPEGAVDPGAHTLRADDLGAGGKVMSRAELPFQRAAFAADDPQAGRVVVQPHQTLWRIARQVYGHGTRYTVIFDANRGQIRDPNRIYPGQVFALPAGGGAAPAR
ncbi:MAG TPA: LysM peptidoglycan-binding domain-containing protein [Acetobacteraceae bacterium]|nr:LysM peptidoglycan-binding domain-containing protein [Acetobacteraceae bacterium]